MIPVNELTDFDYEILEKLALAPMTETALTDSFPKQSAVKHRIALLMGRYALPKIRFILYPNFLKQFRYA